MELPSDSRPMPDAYNAEIREVTVVVQLAQDDGYYGIGLVEGHEIAWVGPFLELQTCLENLGKKIRDGGYWEEPV